MKGMVYYSLFIPPSQDRSDLLWQIETSIRTLRFHNQTIPVEVFFYGERLRAELEVLAKYGVALCDQGSYEERLAALFPKGWRVLQRNPCLHKFLNFAEISARCPQQVLFLDCDTLFFDDVEKLFDRYSAADCYAREEPSCRRSPLGYDVGYLDEEALARLAAREHTHLIPPFNLGIVLFNNRVWNEILQRERIFISYVWRLSVWMALHPLPPSEAPNREGQGIRFLVQNESHLLTPDEAEAALPFPSVNRWIGDQVALWLTLGQVPGLTYDDFSPGHVLQGSEFELRSLSRCDWVATHYFSQNAFRLNDWLTGQTSNDERA